jgi:hypothetical protein
METKNRHLERIIRVAYRYWKSSLPKADESCPDEETLACFIDGLLNKKEQNKLKTHLLKCDRCMEAVALAMRLELSDEK